MSKGLNSLTIIGNIGKDPELRFTPAGVPVVNFSVAVGKPYKKDDEWQEETIWFSVTAWNDLAEGIAEKYSRGTRVYCRGEVGINEYSDKQGQARASLTLTIRSWSDIMMLTMGENRTANQADHGLQFDTTSNEDDLPF